MSELTRSPEPARRVVVAVDVTAQSLGAIETAVRLAVQLEAEVVGVFVEDLDLLNLAALPIGVEITHASGLSRRLDDAQLMRAMRRRSGEARSAVITACTRHALRSSMHVRRGRYLKEALSAASASDVLILGRMSARLRQHGARLRHHPELGRESPDDRCVWVLYGTSEASKRALRVSRWLAGTAGRLVVVVEDEETRRALDQLRLAEEGRGGEPVMGGGFETRLAPDFRSALDAMEAEDPQALVLPRHLDVLADAALRRRLEASSFPVILVP